MATAHIHDPKTGFQTNYYIEERLKVNLDEKVKGKLQKKDKDLFIIVDGKEGSGKSTMAIQIGKYVDPTLDLSRIVFSPEDFREAILKAKKGQCIIYDEAFTGFSSRASLSPVNRVLVSLAMQMRQKNLFVIIVMPTIFLLDKYIAMFRANALVHVYENKGTRGYFKLFNYEKKKLLLLFGAKTMSYNVKMARTRFRGRFYGKFALGDEEVEEKYRKKKEKALSDSEKTSMTSAQVKFRDQRDLVIYLFRKYTGKSYREIENIFMDYDFPMNFSQIARNCAKFGDHEAIKDVKEMERQREEEENMKNNNKGNLSAQKDEKSTPESLDSEKSDGNDP